jgi:hypothetical protein
MNEFGLGALIPSRPFTLEAGAHRRGGMEVTIPYQGSFWSQSCIPDRVDFTCFTLRSGLDGL